jgi:hypothetical protein
MKIWFEKIVSNTSYFKIVFNYYKNDTKEFQSVKCYTISDEELKHKTLNKIKIDTAPLKEQVSQEQKEKICTFINDRILSFHIGETQLSEQELKFYDKTYTQLMRDNKVDRELLDYIVNDMMKDSNINNYQQNSKNDYFY